MRLEECNHCRTSDLSCTGTNRHSGEQVLGPGCCAETALTLSSITLSRHEEENWGQVQGGTVLKELVR